MRKYIWEFIANDYEEVYYVNDINGTNIFQCSYYEATYETIAELVAAHNEVVMSYVEAK